MAARCLGHGFQYRSHNRLIVDFTGCDQPIDAKRQSGPKLHDRIRGYEDPVSTFIFGHVSQSSHRFNQTKADERPTEEGIDFFLFPPVATVYIGVQLSTTTKDKRGHRFRAWLDSLIPRTDGVAIYWKHIRVSGRSATRRAYENLPLTSGSFWFCVIWDMRGMRDGSSEGRIRGNG